LRKQPKSKVSAFPKISTSLDFTHYKSNPISISLKPYYIHISFITFWTFKNF
jgi:hypothetical protein